MFQPAIRRRALIGLIAVPLLLFASAASAQYFGRNKVQYRTFDFKILKTAHFDVYYYGEERTAAEQAARMAERWYDRLSRVLDHQLSTRQPLILYASHPDFEQTNAISGDIGEGTGGVTEFLKRRIVLPLAGPLAESDHVIGHELVHAFQFDITKRPGSSFTEPGVARLPLWFVEGMAEYLSIGPYDPNTAMWMHDAAASNQLPTIRKLEDSRYFPYRYGQAFWAYVGGRWGDEMVGKVLKSSSRGVEAEKLLERTLGESSDSLSRDWHAAIRAWHEPVAHVAQGADTGRVVIRERGSRGRLNVAPALSPDGTKLLFMSERDLFSIELFLADARTGKIERRVTKTAVDPHFQSLQFIQSAGAWSPDGKRFAIAAVVQGAPVLTVIDVASGRTVRELRFPALGEIFHPTWSPDGGRICFSAIAGGLTDLFVADLASGKERRLTSDPEADLQPAWSPDGRRIAFVTDRFGLSLDSLRYGNERLAFIDPETGAITPGPGFDDGKNINPQWSADGGSLYFISDHDGISNVYHAPLDGGAITRVTSARAGVSGITALSPALSVARATDDLVFSSYERRGYVLRGLDGKEALAGHAAGDSLERVHTATLPPVERKRDEVTELVQKQAFGVVSSNTFTRASYRPGLSLDYVSQPSLGVAAGTNGVAVGGGTTLYWSDMLGNHNLATLIQANNAGGDFFNNLALVAAYENRTSRLNWGMAAGQLPYLTRQIVQTEYTRQGEPVLQEDDLRYWQIDRQVQGTLAYPFSRVQRVELSAGYRNISFVSEVQSRLFSEVTGELLDDQTFTNDSFPSLHLATASAALVYDNSVFGGTSPILGQSYRFEASPVAGDLHYVGALGDFRRYVMLKRPLSLAGRVLHFGRYGSGAEDPRLSEVFVGSPWLMHGYDDGSFTVDEVDAGGTSPVVDRLFGSRLAVANAELRLPILGALGIIPSSAIPPVEAALFYDTGVAWTEHDKPSFLGGDRHPLTSYGTALRINLFGLAIGEVAFVHPNDRPIKGWYWQFNLQPGF